MKCSGIVTVAPRRAKDECLWSVAPLAIRFRLIQVKMKTHKSGFQFLVALIGIEPILLAELDFESSASTSSATEP